MGNFHVDIADVPTEAGKLRLCVAIDRSSKYAYVELPTDATTMGAAQFPRNLIATVADKIHTVLTDNGIQFTDRSRGQDAFGHVFERACCEHGIEPRSTKVNHPWTNG